MSETYDTWVDKMISGQQTGPLGDEAATSKGKAYAVIQLAATEREFYTAEVGSKGKDFIYHFFLTDKTPANFEDKLGDAFLAIFKMEDRVKSSYVEELKSWSVIALGYAENVLADESRVFDELDRRLQS